ncbi:MAG: DUF2752 domain-containing protein [Acidobacteriota bacterium]
MPQTASRLDPELAPHFWVMILALGATLAVWLWPQWVVHAGYRCQMQVLLGVRCPFCGMTRDFAAMLHGQGAPLNPCSRPVAGLVYVVYPAAVLVAWRRKRLDWFYGTKLRWGVSIALVLMTVLNNLR